MKANTAKTTIKRNTAYSIEQLQNPNNRPY